MNLKVIVVKLFKSFQKAFGSWNTDKIIERLIITLTTIPGLLAWLLEVAAMIGAVICIVVAVRQALIFAFWQSIFLFLSTAALISIALLTARYSKPHEENKGGAS
jgi:hypothetical protein